mgnify:CR=1 FL=1
MTPRFHSLRIAEVRRETQDCVSLRFEVPRDVVDDYRFVQGQHLALRTRLDFISRYGDTPVLVFGSHFATPSAGRIVRDGDAWRLAL